MEKNQQFPRVAVGAVIIEDKKVLLVKRSNPPAQGLWAIPGGKILPGETLQDALKREILEETGLQIIADDVVHVFDVIERENGKIVFHYVIIDFACRILSGKPAAGDDALEVRWFCAKDLEKVNVSSKTLELLTHKFNFF